MTKSGLTVVAFTKINRSFYPTTSAIHPVSVLIFRPKTDTNYEGTYRKTEKTKIIANHSKVSKTNADVPGTKALQAREPRK